MSHLPATTTRIATLLASALAFFSTDARAGGAEKNEIVIGRKFSIESAILQEKREYIVYLPAPYHDRLYAKVRYPVMYLLDGEEYFNAAAGLVHFMSEANSQIPQQIVVAVVNTNRTRDLTPTPSNIDISGKVNAAFGTTGGGDRFLQFLERELIPKIEADYRTAPHRTLVGHSFGGLTVLHSLLTQPGLYQGLIAIDSSLWWQDQFMVKRVKQGPVDVPDRGTRVFMALGDHRTTGEYDGSSMIVTNMRFAELLQGRKLQGLDVTLRHFAGEDHGTVPLPALYNGLLYVFDGYKVGDEFALKDNTAELVAHFRKISERLGYEVLPPEQLVDRFGQGAYGFLHDAKLAMEYAMLNVANYSTSSHALSSLASLELATGEMQRARVHLGEALRLNPDNEEARSALESLQQKR
ncbi:MAG: alpha/beta hydrolase [Proteobacteria bacterium]|nr:alpha/beta hydrolase [Pseudomonadota bacterium]